MKITIKKILNLKEGKDRVVENKEDLKVVQTEANKDQVVKTETIDLNNRTREAEVAERIKKGEAKMIKDYQRMKLWMPWKRFLTSSKTRKTQVTWLLLRELSLEFRITTLI